MWDLKMCCILSFQQTLPCSDDSLEEAPTEAGFHLGGHIEKVLNELGDDQQQLRRYSRSFSEPNLAMHFLQAVSPSLKACLAYHVHIFLFLSAHLEDV